MGTMGESPAGIDRASSGPRLAGLVDELDARLRDPGPARALGAASSASVAHEPLGRQAVGDDIEIIQDRRPWYVPTWVAFMVLSIAFVGLSWLVLRPNLSTCEYSDAICRIEHLDIDALLITIPDADLFDVLPSIDELDPDDNLTLADVLRSQALSGLDPSDLISRSEIERLLREAEPNSD